MSLQSAKEFIQRVESDQALQERLHAAADDEARQQIIRDAGFGFTQDEFHQAVKELAAAAGQQLTPEELQEIAAGAGRNWHNSACGCHSGIGVGADI